MRPKIASPATRCEWSGSPNALKAVLHADLRTWQGPVFAMSTALCIAPPVLGYARPKVPVTRKAASCTYGGKHYSYADRYQSHCRSTVDILDLDNPFRLHLLPGPSKLKYMLQDNQEGRCHELWYLDRAEPHPNCFLWKLLSFYVAISKLIGFCWSKSNERSVSWIIKDNQDISSGKIHKLCSWEVHVSACSIGLNISVGDQKTWSLQYWLNSLSRLATCAPLCGESPSWSLSRAMDADVLFIVEALRSYYMSMQWSCNQVRQARVMPQDQKGATFQKLLHLLCKIVIAKGSDKAYFVAQLAKGCSYIGWSSARVWSPEQQSYFKPSFARQKIRTATCEMQEAVIIIEHALRMQSKLYPVACNLCSGDIVNTHEWSTIVRPEFTGIPFKRLMSLTRTWLVPLEHPSDPLSNLQCKHARSRTSNVCIGRHQLGAWRARCESQSTTVVDLSWE